MNVETCREEGGCACGQTRYQLTGSPLIVHGCHCRGCQKNSGSSFAINALFEANRVELISGEVDTISVPTPSGTGQDITRCAECKVAIWSNYNMGGPLRKFIRFVRVGTLDYPDKLPPDVHIYTCSKQPWVVLPKEHKQVNLFYERSDTWSPESMERLAKLKESASIKNS